MLYYLLFWMFVGFIIHFYIIFGTNLLTQCQFLFFPLFQCFAEKEYQMESKRNETFGRVIFRTEAIQETWSIRQGSNEEAMRQGGAPYPWARLHPRGPLVAPLTYFFLLYIPIYPKTMGNRIDRELRRRKPL